MNENINAFGHLAADRLRESIEDLELFNVFLNSIRNLDEITATFSSDPTLQIRDVSMFMFTVSSGVLTMQFHITFITDEINKALSYDPFFVDISYLTDITVNDLEKDDVLEILDSISGFYVDPTRPFSWLVDKSRFADSATIEDAAAIFITVLKDYFYMQIEKASHLKLVIDNTK